MAPAAGKAGSPASAAAAPPRPPPRPPPAAAAGAVPPGIIFVDSITGAIVGSSVPRWHVKQVTSVRPLKLFLLISITILIMARATVFVGFASLDWSGSA